MTGPVVTNDLVDQPTFAGLLVGENSELPEGRVWRGGKAMSDRVGTT